MTLDNVDSLLLSIAVVQPYRQTMLALGSVPLAALNTLENVMHTSPRVVAAQPAGRPVTTSPSAIREAL